MSEGGGVLPSVATWLNIATIRNISNLLPEAIKQENMNPKVNRTKEIFLSPILITMKPFELWQF